MTRFGAQKAALSLLGNPRAVVSWIVAAMFAVSAPLVAQTPISLTGWNEDVILEKTGVPSVTLPLDSSDYTFAETGIVVHDTYKYIAPNWVNQGSSPPPLEFGLPSDRIVNSLATNTVTGTHTSFALQDYTAANAVLMKGGGSAVKLDLAIPQRFSSLAILNTSMGSDEGTLQPILVTLKFQNDPNSVTFTYDSNAWRQETNHPLALDAAISRMDRVHVSSGHADALYLDQTKFVMYETDINLTSYGYDQKLIESMTFQKVSNFTASVYQSAVFAVNGSASGNRNDFFQGNDLFNNGNYTLNANNSIHRLPTANSDDVVLTAASNQTLVINNSNLVMGSLNVLESTSKTIRNEGNGTSNLTLGTSSNSVAGSREDLIYLGPNAGNLTLVGSNAGGLFNISLTRTGNLDVANSNSTLSISAAISGNSFGINKTGLGTVILSGDNSFSGRTTVNEGGLEAAANGALAATSDVVVNTGGTLLLSGSASNRVSDAAPLSIASGGTLQFGGNSSETLGALTLTAGSILDFGSSLENFEVLFASLQLPETGYATILNWNGSLLQGFGAATDRLLFTTVPGLASTDALRFDIGGTLHSARFVQLGNTGVYEALPNQTLAAVPEPTTLFGGFALLGLCAFARRTRPLRSGNHF